MSIPTHTDDPEVTTDELDRLIAEAEELEDTPPAKKNEQHTQHKQHVDNSESVEPLNDNADSENYTIESEYNHENVQLDNTVGETIDVEDYDQTSRGNTIEWDDLKNNPRVKILGVIIILLMTYFLYPSDPATDRVSIPQNISGSQNRDVTSPNTLDMQVESLLDISDSTTPNNDEPLPADHPDVKTSPPEGSAIVDETHLAKVLGLVDETGQLMSLVEQKEMDQTKLEIIQLKVLVEKMSVNAVKQDNILSKLEKELSLLSDTVNNYIQKQASENKRKSNIRPNISVLQLVEAFGCDSCSQSVHILDHETGKKRIYSIGDTINGFTIHINGDRVTLKNTREQYTFRIES